MRVIEELSHRGFVQAGILFLLTVLISLKKMPLLKKKKKKERQEKVEKDYPVVVGAPN